MLYEGLPDNCKTKIELGADPWTRQEHFLRALANISHSTYAVLYNTHRDRDKAPKPYEFEPIPGPEIKRTPEQIAEAERIEAEELAAAELERKHIHIQHDVGMALMRGEITMAELSAMAMSN